MTVEAQKTRLAGRVWQSIAQSGVNVSAIPRDQLEKLVQTVSDGVLQEFDAMLGEMDLQGDAAASQDSASQAPGGETVLWEGRPFLSLRHHYIVTDQRVRIITGLLGRETDDIELIRIKDVDHTQGITERMLNIGDIQLRSADSSRPNATLNNVTEPEKVHEIIRRAVLEARKRYPFIFEQNM
jgi:hypothetical protein